MYELTCPHCEFKRSASFVRVDAVTVCPKCEQAFQIEAQHVHRLSGPTEAAPKSPGDAALRPSDAAKPASAPPPMIQVADHAASSVVMADSPNELLHPPVPKEEAASPSEPRHRSIGPLSWRELTYWAIGLLLLLVILLLAGRFRQEASLAPSSDTSFIAPLNPPPSAPPDAP